MTRDVTHTLGADEEDWRNEREGGRWDCSSPGSCSAFAHVTLHLTNIVGGLAVGRRWKGDSSPSSLDKYPPAAGGGGGGLIPSSFSSLAFGPQFPECPHSTCPTPMRMLWMDSSGNGPLPRGYPASHQPALSYLCLGFLGALLCGRWHILVLTAPPWQQSDLGKGGFPSLDRAPSHSASRGAHSSRKVSP